MRKGFSYLWSYLGRRWLTLVCVAAALLLPLLTCYLSGMALSPFRYGAGVALFIIACLLTADLFSFARKLRRLEMLRGCIPLPQNTSAVFPRPGDRAEASYQELLTCLNAALLTDRSDADKRFNDALEYYTLWVHQIKTPIAAMRLVLGAPDPDPGTLKQELFKVEQYADLALKFIKLSDIASDLVIFRVDLNDLVRQAVKKFSVPFIYEKLTVSIQPLATDVVSDPKWLSFILEQLISNALKYTRSGGVSFYMENDALVVADTGIGIRPEDLPRIFEKGYTGFNGRLDSRASGVGLYLCRMAGNALGVTLSASSEVGKGTQMRIRFPERLPDAAENLTLSGAKQAAGIGSKVTNL